MCLLGQDESEGKKVGILAGSSQENFESIKIYLNPPKIQKKFPQNPPKSN